MKIGLLMSYMLKIKNNSKKKQRKFFFIFLWISLDILLQRHHPLLCSFRSFFLFASSGVWIFAFQNLQDMPHHISQDAFLTELNKLMKSNREKGTLYITFKGISIFSSKECPTSSFCSTFPPTKEKSSRVIFIIFCKFKF